MSFKQRPQSSIALVERRHQSHPNSARPHSLQMQVTPDPGDTRIVFSKSQGKQEVTKRSSGLNSFCEGGDKQEMDEEGKLNQQLMYKKKGVCLCVFTSHSFLFLVRLFS